MKKQLFLDFDNVIIDTVKAYCNLYSVLYRENPKFKEPYPSKVWRYDMRDECPLVTNMDELFGHEFLYKNAPFYDEHTEEVLRELNMEFDVVITTIGTWRNLFYKEQWLQERLPFIKDVIYQRTTRFHGKKALNMHGAYFVDDNFINLFSSNASLKVCFGRCGEWNEHWLWGRVEGWQQLGQLLIPESGTEKSNWERKYADI